MRDAHAVGEVVRKVAAVAVCAEPCGGPVAADAVRVQTHVSQVWNKMWALIQQQQHSGTDPGGRFDIVNKKQKPRVVWKDEK